MKLVLNVILHPGHSMELMLPPLVGLCADTFSLAVKISAI